MNSEKKKLFREFYRENYPFLMNYAYRLLRNRDVAEVLVHEVCYELLEEIGVIEDKEVLFQRAVDSLRTKLKDIRGT